MFFLHNLSRTITLHPSFFGPKVNEYLTSKLYEDVEGQCVGSYYIVCIVDIIDISEGKIIPGLGKAEYTVWYRAVLWRPFRGEVLDALVDGQVNRMGFFCSAGPGRIFVSSWQMPRELKFRPDSNPPSYSDDEGDQTIQQGSHVRIKLIGARFEGGHIFGVGTMKEDYLGFVCFTVSTVACLLTLARTL